MRPVKTRHIGFSVIVTTVVCAREVYISRGLPSEAPRHNVWERNQLTDYDQIELSPFCCHCWGGGAGRERWQGIERWEGVGFYKARRTPRAKTSARPAAFPRTRAILSRRLCHPALFSMVKFILYWIFNIYIYFIYFLLFFSVLFFLQYRPSDLYLRDRKEANGNFAKRYPHPSPHLQIRPSLVHPFVSQDKLLIQMHLDVPCNARASCKFLFK